MSAYEPEIGDLVHDETTRKSGAAVDRVGPHWQLKPPGGGTERTVSPAALRSPTDAEAWRVQVWTRLVGSL
ncbi:hypothetical protein ACFYZ9_03375 [Streptomyces sp. NPDC001691]|uniref:hypothetical protein n=1 Tax=Streptomyces sp. NPDC001691 TaxID=3364600 RepID=UPI003696CCEC